MKNIPFYCDITCFLFILYVTLNAYINSPTTEASLFPLWGMGGLYFLCRWLFAYIPFIQIWICIALFTVGVYQVSVGFGQLNNPATSSYRLFNISGSFSSPAFYAIFLSCLIPVAIHSIFNPSPVHKILRVFLQVYSIVYILLALRMLPHSMNRSCLVACLTGISIVLFKAYRIGDLIKEVICEEEYRVFIRRTITLLVISLFVSGITFMKNDPDDNRLLIWKITTGIISEHPLTGIGFKRFAGEYGNAQADYFAAHANEKNMIVRKEVQIAGSPATGFNEYLHIAAENGLPALILFVILICLVIFYLYRNKEFGFLGSMITFLVFSFFSNPFSTKYIGSFFVILLALSLAHSQIKTSSTRLRHIPLLFLILLTYPLLQNHSSWYARQKALQEWNKHRDTYTPNTTLFRQLYPQLRDEPEFLFEWGKHLHDKKEYKESNQILKEGLLFSSDPMFWNIMGKNYQQCGEYHQAETCYLHAHHMVPNRFYPLYLLTHLYLDMFKYDKGLEMTERIVNKKIKVNSSAIKEMKANIKHRLKSIGLDIMEELDNNPYPCRKDYSYIYFDEKKIQTLSIN